MVKFVENYSDMFVLQPTLKNETVLLEPLQEGDFEALYSAASNPEIWQQHPNRDRYKREVFENFFKGATDSGGAFRIIDEKTGRIIGSTRFYDYSEEKGEVFIGYTFLSTSFWGGRYNPAVKKLMLDHAFQFVDTVLFHIGTKNIRSQKAIERLGAKKTGEEFIAYYGEQSKLNCIYRIEKKDWLK